MRAQKRVPFILMLFPLPAKLASPPHHFYQLTCPNCRIQLKCHFLLLAPLAWAAAHRTYLLTKVSYLLLVSLPREAVSPTGARTESPGAQHRA